MNFAVPPMYNAHSDPEANGTFFMSEFTNALMHGYRINPRRQLQIIANCTRKVLIPGQVAIISFMPNAILWVTNNSQLEVGSSANDADEIADALETRLPRDLSERVGDRIIRTAEQATLGIQCRTSFEMKAGDKNIKVGFDCYHEEPDFLTVVTLLTPISDDYINSYDQAQLSSLRYLVGVITSGHDDMNILAATLESLEVSKDYEKYIRSIAPDYRSKGGYAQSTASTDIVTPADAFDTDETEATHNPNTPHIYDFIPSMTFREIDYFYSMILGTAIGTYRRHETELQHSESVDEQEKQTIDPDDMDPNERMRSIQEQAIFPVTQRRLRVPADIRAELEEQKLRAQIPTPKESSPAQRGPGNLKNVGIKCLECGVDSSPEWRKGPNGPKTLCNRCGLRYAKSLKTQGR